MEELSDGEGGGDAESTEERRRVRSVFELCRVQNAKEMDSPYDGSKREHLRRKKKANRGQFELLRSDASRFASTH